MTIQDYLDKIESLQREKTKITFSDNDDLEFYVQKILQNAESFFMLDDVLQKTSDRILLNNEALKLFANRLGLLFLEEKELGNVCFANSEEVRPEYRQSFKLIDFLDYIYAFMHSDVFVESQKIIITSETDLFWKLAKIGSSLREI
ncbi:hypothetical protein LPB248_04215 [Flavobacterium sp. LPB0248]|uniref:hypothetical protein n=1 Tax=Flavobacterium sp. LPB0248 TaxID=2614441 RepID=UPI0015A51372|nr:hypothetical protein [Flavobacterium sp. LPB0248]QLC65522.1 hypothetical protein LPB248_04215 [Flavobacterium sp. LPB0248]